MRWLIPLLMACVSDPLAAGIAQSSSKAVKSVTISPDSMTLYVGDVGRASCTPWNGVNGTGTALANVCTWRVIPITDTAIVKPTSNSQYSNITARKVGNTRVVASVGSKSDTLPVTVTCANTSIDRVEVTPEVVADTIGKVALLTGTIYKTCGGTATGTVVWLSRDDAVATVTSTSTPQTGSVTLVGAGVTYVLGSVTVGSTVKKDSARIEVTSDTLPTPIPLADSGWAGINANTGFNTASGYVTAVNDAVNDLGLSGVRMGMDGVGGSTSGSGFTFTTRDATVASHQAADLGIRAVISFRSQVSHGANTTDWQTNWKYFVGGVLRHYAGTVDYYIIDNEPELNGITDASFAVAMTKIAYDTAQAIGGIKIESPPTGSAAASFLHSMIDLGVTRYCDYLGVHGYGGQINDAHSQSIKTPWAWMVTANGVSGYPIRAVANSENGFDAGYGGRTWQARSFQLSYVQHKRYGYDHILLYSIRSTAGTNFDVAGWSGTAITPNQPTYDAVKAGFIARPFANGDFEAANNVDTEWVIYWNTAQIGTPIEWSRAVFVTGDAVNAHGGSRYLRFDTGESAAGNIVRRVVEGLTPGDLYTLSAWVKINGGGTATLKALGYNSLLGTQESTQSTSTTGTWTQRTVTFTPTKTWVVISLEGTGTNVAGQTMTWDDVTLSP